MPGERLQHIHLPQVLDGTVPPHSLAWKVPLFPLFLSSLEGPAYKDTSILSSQAPLLFFQSLEVKALKGPQCLDYHEI